MPLRLSGLIAAPHTPMHADGALNLGVVEDQVRVLVEGGVSGAFVCGTTGEGMSLTTDERKQVVERWVAVATGHLPVIAHVGHTSAAEASILAAHAARAGVAAISAMAPCFFKPSTIAELIAFCVPVAAAAGDVPFYFYHIPSMTGVALPMVEFFHRAAEKIPNFAGIKFTHNDLMEFQQCLALAGDSRDVLFGRDEILVAGLTVGAKGAIGSTYNYAAPLFRKLMDAFHRGDLAAARGHQATVHRFVEVLRKFGDVPTGKAIMNMMGINVGFPRTPLPRHSPEQLGEIHRELRKLDIFTRPIKPIFA
jgi:N-acetylneuraminate lyase